MLTGCTIDGRRGSARPGRAWRICSVLRRELDDPRTGPSRGCRGAPRSADGRAWIRPLVDAGLLVAWVCHVGVDAPTEVVRIRVGCPPAGRREGPPRLRVLSPRDVWEGLERRNVAVIPPCIDPTSPKNMDIPPMEATWVLQAARVLEGEPRGHSSSPSMGSERSGSGRDADSIEEGPRRRTGRSWHRSPGGTA